MTIRDRKDEADEVQDARGGQHEMSTKKENNSCDEFSVSAVDLIERIEELEADMQEAKKYSHLAADALEMLHERLEKLETLVINFLKLQEIDTLAKTTSNKKNDEELDPDTDATHSAGLVYL